MTEEKTPIDHVVEAALYAPIGFALEARRLLPDFVERGRQQVNMAKMVGQFAVTHGQATASKRMSKLQEQAEAILHEFGIGVPEPVAAPAPSVPDSAPAAPAATGEPAAERPGAAAGELAIADYDSLAASQVIPRLEGLDAGQLEAIRAYEAAGRGRKTILGKIAQLTDR